LAKVSAHGREVGTVYFTTTAKRYMSDGTVLKNDGHGWKIYGKVKAGVTPEQAHANAAARQAKLLAERPELAAYRRALHAQAGLSKRWKLHATIELMPDDPDGVWSETCDGYGDNVHADLDDIVKLCKLFREVVERGKIRAQMAAQTAAATAGEARV
jgi:hypothetical protein